MKRASALCAFLLLPILLGPWSEARCDDSPPSNHAAKASASPAVSPARSANSTPAAQATAAPSSNAASSNGTSNGSQPPSAKPGRLPELVVTATRVEEPINDIGTSISVVEGSDMRAQKIDDIADALRQVPGVEVSQTGSPGTITGVQIRGATAEQTLVLVDGVEVNNVTDGQFDFANLTTDNVSRVEVLRGAGGSLYGSNAVGGVVNLLTEEGSGPPKFSMLSEGGNRATQRQLLTGSGADDNIGLGYSGSLSYFSTTGFRPINDSSDNLAGTLRLDEHFGDDTVARFFARYSRSNVSLVNFSVASGSPIDPNAHQRDEFMLFKGALEHRFGDKLLVRWNAAYVRSEIRVNAYPYPANTSSESTEDADENRTTTLDAVYDWGWSGLRSLMGFQFQDRWARSGDNSVFPAFDFASITVFSHRRQEYGGFVQQQGSFFNGRLLATAGFRVDGFSDFGKEVSPQWSVAIPLDEVGLTFRGSYSEGFQAPSFDDLYFPGFGNPDLNPELSSEYDGGFTKRFGEYASFNATYFSRRVHNLIVPVPCPFGPDCPFGSLAGNIGRVDMQGVELEPSIGPFWGLQLSGSFTLLEETHKPTVSLVNGNLTPSPRPVRVPKHSAAGILEYEHASTFRPGDRIRASLVYSFIGDRDDIDQVGAIRSHVGYQLFNATVSYAFGIPMGLIQGEEVYARVQNMFDRNYSQNFGFKSPPVNFVAGVKFDFGATPMPSVK